MSLKKVISGGQTGIDQIGLELAQKYGFQTGGHIPKRFLTENGCDLLLARFGLIETQSDSYEVRTKLNVCNSDGTLIFGDKNSPGTRLTISNTNRFKVPMCINPVSAEEVLNFIKSNNIVTLNIAGTRGSKLSFVVRSRVIAILSEVFQKLIPV